MATKYLYWNSESNSGTSFNYSRLITDPERAALIPGKTMIFGITYRSTSGTLYPALTISNLKLCSTAAVSVTEIPRSESVETVGGKQIVTKYFSATVPELVVGNSSLTFSLSFNSSATILDCALFQGSALSMKNVHEVDKFSQFMKYDGGWKIRTGTGENDFVELTTATSLSQHASKYTDVHLKPGVSGDIVGTIGIQSLANKTLNAPTINHEEQNLKGSIFLNETQIPISSEVANNKTILTAKAVMTAIAGLGDTDVGAHNNQFTPLTGDPIKTLHGLSTINATNYIIGGSEPDQSLRNKIYHSPKIIGNLNLFGSESTTNTGYKGDKTFVSGTEISNVNTPIASNANQLHLPTNKSVVDYIKSLFIPVYFSYHYNEHYSPANTLYGTTNILRKYPSNNSSNVTLNKSWIDPITNSEGLTITHEGTAISADDCLILKFDKLGVYTIHFDFYLLTGNFGGGRGAIEENIMRILTANKSGLNLSFSNTSAPKSFVRWIFDSEGSENYMTGSASLTKTVYCSNTSNPIYVTFFASKTGDYNYSNISVDFKPVII